VFFNFTEVPQNKLKIKLGEVFEKNWRLERTTVSATDSETAVSTAQNRVNRPCQLGKSGRALIA